MNLLSKFRFQIFLNIQTVKVQSSVCNEIFSFAHPKRTFPSGLPRRNCKQQFSDLKFILGMATESLLDLSNHTHKCRLCLKEFELDDTQIKLTQIVQIRFFELTQLQVSLFLFPSLSGAFSINLNYFYSLKDPMSSARSFASAATMS